MARLSDTPTPDTPLLEVLRAMAHEEAQIAVVVAQARGADGLHLGTLWFAGIESGLRVALADPDLARRLLADIRAIPLAGLDLTKSEGRILERLQAAAASEARA